MYSLENLSEPEKEVAKFLNELGIWWKYEWPFFLYDENDRPRIWTPDFFLPVIGVYVEVCGTDEFDYFYREKIYDKNVCRVIFVHYYKEPEKWKTFLVQRLFDMQIKRLRETGSAIQKARKMGFEIQTKI